jgi:sec-independent protein translocase protein TatA
MMAEVLAFLPQLGPWEIALIVIVILLLFGGKKLPELAKGIGKGMRVFKKELNDVRDTVETALNEEPKPEAKPEPKPEPKQPAAEETKEKQETT